MSIYQWCKKNLLFVTAIFFGLIFFIKGYVLTAAFGIENINPEELKQKFDSNNSIYILDVRTIEEYSEISIKEAKNLPVDQLANDSQKILPKNKDEVIYVICRSGQRSVMGSITLKNMGYKNVYNVTEGMIGWSNRQYPVATNR
jgi:rhodanese-related sulfurtransferase